MANETILKFGTPKTLESSGLPISNNTVVAATSTYSVVDDGGFYPDAKFVASFQFSTAPVEGSVLSLYARPMGLTNGDAQPPDVTWPNQYVGSFVVDNVTTIQNAEFIAHDVPWFAEYYLHNNGTGQSVGPSWTLVAYPFTVGPAA